MSLQDHLPELFDLAAAAEHRGDRAHWKIAALASRLVGLHQKGLTAELAAKIGRSADTVERRAHAMNLCRMLRRKIGFWEIRYLEKYLSLSHFGAAAEKNRQYMMPPSMIYEYLRGAMGDDGRIQSSRAMAQFIDQTARPEEYNEWLEAARKLLRQIDKFVNTPSMGIDEEMAIRCVSEARSLKRVMEAVI